MWKLSLGQWCFENGKNSLDNDQVCQHVAAASHPPTRPLSCFYVLVLKFIEINNIGVVIDSQWTLILSNWVHTEIG